MKLFTRVAKTSQVPLKISLLILFAKEGKTDYFFGVTTIRSVGREIEFESMIND